MRTTEEKQTLGPDAPTFDIGVLIGNKKFKFIKLLAGGKLKYLNDTIDVNGLVIDFTVDQQNDTGFYYIE